MTSARIRTGVRAGALTSALIVLGAVPAGAVTQRPALSPGCTEGDNGRVTCTFTNPTTGDPAVVDVPNRVTSATITVRGGAGGDGALATLFGAPALSPGGAGGTAVATLTVDPAKDLEVRVGGAGESGLDGGAGGVGGGAGGAGSAVGLPPVIALLGGGGGGGSEVRVSGTNPASDDPLIAAGGGGGGGSGTFGLIPGPGPGGAGGGATGEDGPGIDIGILLAGGGKGGTATDGGAGGTFIDGVSGLIEGEAGSRGTGGAAATDLLPGIGVGGTGAGGGGGGYFGGGGGSILSGGGGGSGFGPDGTVFGTGPAPDAPFTEAALPDGEVIIEFAAPEPEDDGSGSGSGDEDGDGGGSGGSGSGGGGDAGGGAGDPCSDVARLTVSDRLPLIPLSC